MTNSQKREWPETVILALTGPYTSPVLLSAEEGTRYPTRRYIPADSPNVLTAEEATAIVAALFSEDHDAETRSAVVKRLGDWLDTAIYYIDYSQEAPDA